MTNQRFRRGQVFAMVGVVGILAVVAMPAACDSIASVVGYSAGADAGRVSTGASGKAAAAVRSGDAATTDVLTASHLVQRQLGVSRVVSAGSLRRPHSAPVVAALVVALFLLFLAGRPRGLLLASYAVSDGESRAGPGPRAPPVSPCPDARSRPRRALWRFAVLGDARGSEETQCPNSLMHRANPMFVFSPGYGAAGF